MVRKLNTQIERKRIVINIKVRSIAKAPKLSIDWKRRTITNTSQHLIRYTEAAKEEHKVKEMCSLDKIVDQCM